jgi:hypothetical protein
VGLPEIYTAMTAWSDYNADGYVDVLFNGCADLECSSYATQLYRNNGDGTFTQDTSVGPPDAFAWLAWGDYNSDGRPDLLAWQIQPGWTATIFKNENLISGLPPNPPTGLRARLTGRRDVSFVWNASDSKTTSTAVGYNLRVGTASGIGDVVSPLANDGGSRQLVQPGNAEEKTFAKLRLLAPGTYYWSVQSIGADFAGSDFAREQKLTIPAKVSLKLSASKISLCGQAPRSVVASGKVDPAFSPVATVILKRAFGPHAGFKKFATAKTSSSGAFRVRGVGKTLKRSFWVRAMTETKLASRRLVSVSRLVSVDSSCRVAEK